MARDLRTAKYVIELTVNITEQNAYGDALNADGFLHYKKEVRAKNLTELGQLLQRFEENL